MKKKLATISIFLCAVFEMAAQSNVDQWSKKFDVFQSTLKKTTLHLTFNQTKFSPGDTAWFKAYFLNEDFTYVGGKQLIDLHVVDTEGQSHLHLLFNVNDGVGQNQIALPTSLTAGIYIITA